MSPWLRHKDSFMYKPKETRSRLWSPIGTTNLSLDLIASSLTLSKENTPFGESITFIIHDTITLFFIYIRAFNIFNII